MIVNVSAFVDDETIRKDLNRAAVIRSEALALAYSIKGYEAAPLPVKNWIYDRIKSTLERM